MQTPELEGAEIVLHDINPRHLKDLHACCQAILGQLGRAEVFKVSADLNLNTALRGAAAVILTITTGGYAAMANDLRIPYRFGIYQPVADTVGPGGISRALRNIPVVVGIAQAMARECPGAWLVNLTNPMTTLVRAVWRETDVRCVGLCHELYETLHVVEALLGAKDWRSEFDFDVVGVNHMPWITRMTYKGRDAFPEIRRRVAKGAWDGGTGDRKDPAGIPISGSHRVKRLLFEAFGVLPGASDRHVVEFFPFFCTEEMRRGAAVGVDLTTIEERRRVFTPGWKRNVKAFTSGKTKISPQVSHEAASKIIAALLGAGKWRDVVNIPNVGQAPQLPRGAVVETMGEVTRDRIRGTRVGAIPPGVLTQIERHIAVQEMTVEAALAGDRDQVLQAMLGDPLCGSVRRYQDLVKMRDALLAANRAWLPRFFPEGSAKRKGLK